MTIRNCAGHAQEIANAAERATSLTRQLLAFSRKQMLAPKIVDLNSVVTENVKMLTRLIGEDIDLVMVPGPDIGAVKADPGQIEQVIMNLAVNARDAMPKGGKLTIETANVTLDANYARFHAPVKPGDYVMLAISDTGMGMDAETQAHIFEPFYTTKGLKGHGSRTVHGVRHRQAKRRLHLAVQRNRQRHFIQDLSAPLQRHGRSPRHSARSGAGTAEQGSTKRFCWWKTKKTCAAWRVSPWKTRDTT